MGLLANFDIELGFIIVQGYKIYPRRHVPDQLTISPPRLHYVDVASVRFTNEVHREIVERATAAYKAKAAEVGGATTSLEVKQPTAGAGKDGRKAG